MEKWPSHHRVEPPMAEEIGFTSGKKVLDAKSDSEYLKKLEAAMENFKRHLLRKKLMLQYVLLFCFFMIF